MSGTTTTTPTIAWFEIPTTNTNQQFSVTLNGNNYVLTLIYRASFIGGGWILDIADGNNNNLVCGIPLVSGVNLLDQYATLGINGILVTSTDGNFFAPPTFDNLGTTSHLWFGVRTS